MGERISELELYSRDLRERRGRILRSLEGLDASALNWQPLSQGTNSLWVLATHALGAERYWIHKLVGRRPVERDRNAEFRTRAEGPADLRAAYAAAAQETEQVLSGFKGDLDAVQSFEHGATTVRWCILHVIGHYAEHAGQMELTRQLWESKEKT